MHTFINFFVKIEGVDDNGNTDVTVNLLTVLIVVAIIALLFYILRHRHRL